jgi:AcrR family transcriptional regulator
VVPPTHAEQADHGATFVPNLGQSAQPHPSALGTLPTTYGVSSARMGNVRTERPLRKDAVANRAKVLEAARAVFAEHGSNARVDRIAELAGVGVPTLYRHFGSRELLLRAVLDDDMSDLADRIEASDGSLDTLIETLVRAVTKNRSLVQLSLHMGGHRHRSAAARRLDAAVAARLDAARERGEVATDVEVGDLIVLLGAIDRAVEINRASHTDLAHYRKLLRRALGPET